MPDMLEVASRWQQIIVTLQKEISAVAETQRLWIEQHLANIHHLQSQLHQLFLLGDGASHCRRCLGSCCERGNNHMTLVNVLGCLFADSLPAADFSRTCPFLGDAGCTLPVQTRPFNCVTFICDVIEESLSVEQQAQFYALEKQLRAQYKAFDQRYYGSSLHGLLIRAEGMSGSRFLAIRS